MGNLEKFQDIQIPEFKSKVPEESIAHLGEHEQKAIHTLSVLEQSSAYLTTILGTIHANCCNIEERLNHLAVELERHKKESTNEVSGINSELANAIESTKKRLEMKVLLLETAKSVHHTASRLDHLEKNVLPSVMKSARLNKVLMLFSIAAGAASGAFLFRMVLRHWTDWF